MLKTSQEVGLFFAILSALALGIIWIVSHFIQIPPIGFIIPAVFFAAGVVKFVYSWAARKILNRLYKQ